MPSRNLWFRIFVPTATQPLPIIVFFHGGGFAYLMADTKDYDAICCRFASKILAVVMSVNYRLAPEYRYPAWYDDGFDVLKFLDERKLQVPPENFSSATALALILLTMVRKEQKLFVRVGLRQVM
ncbi:hypothetical protein Vadar_003450 [Vaccinium darrowii]|uniref:Uncharacterized protein n=1 Tax=Vaccinium darrowii TaxID=229202 RepID=A0ACB7XFD4_9ERIC|nr:hypothetical protein Vadar_003450 [Vaccinium darrowii]